MTTRLALPIALLAALLVGLPSGPVIAERERDQPDAAEARDREREGPAEPQIARERDEPDEGYEEGVPDTGAARQGDRYWIRPGGWLLGVYARNTDSGVRITRTLDGMPAATVGLERGDLIVTVDGYQVGYVAGRLYSLGEELQRRADARGRVTLLVQNVRNARLVNMAVPLERVEPPFRQRD